MFEGLHMSTISCLFSLLDFKEHSNSASKNSVQSILMQDRAKTGRERCSSQSKCGCEPASRIGKTSDLLKML